MRCGLCYGYQNGDGANAEAPIQRITNRDGNRHGSSTHTCTVNIHVHDDAYNYYGGDSKANPSVFHRSQDGGCVFTNTLHPYKCARKHMCLNLSKATAVEQRKKVILVRSNRATGNGNLSLS